MFPSIPKPTNPVFQEVVSVKISQQLSQTQMTCTQKAKDLSMNFREWQWFARGSLNTLNSVPAHTRAAQQSSSQHQGHSPSTCSALCRQSSSPHAAHWCEHINKFSLQVTHYLFRKWKTLKNSINLPGNICYILKPCWIKPGLWTYFRQKQENSQSLMMRRIQQCRSS